jgi:predicted RNase H-like HicB family nuclease
MMEIPVLIEPTSGNGFRARTGEPLVLAAEGATRDEALGRLRNLIEARVNAGAEIVPLGFPASRHSLVRFAGIFKDDPLVDEWMQIMQELRREADEDPDIL